MPIVEVRGRSFEINEQGEAVRLPFTSKNGKHWCAKPVIWRLSRGYIRANIRVDGSSQNIHQHRMLMDAFVGPCPEGYVVDHIDGDRANNSLSNLRYISHAENLRAKRKPKSTACSSRYRGVSWVPKRKLWLVLIGDGSRKSVRVGTYTCENEAALAWNKAAKDRGYPEEALNVVDSY